MAFTYDTTTDLGKLRFEIGDTTSGTGVKPDGTNLTDAELTLLLTREGTVGLATCAVCEILARHWSRMASVTVGARSETMADVAKAWAERAKELRVQYGGSATGFITDLLRDDAYHTYNPFQDDNGNEYGDSRTIYVRP